MENGKPNLDDVFKKTINLYGETLGITLYERRQHRKFNNNNNNKNYKNRGDYRNKNNKGDYNKGDYYTFKNNRYNNNSNRSFRGSKKSNTSTSPKYKKTEEEFKILERPASKKVLFLYINS